MITYESICEKLGFDPILGNTNIYDNLPNYECDSWVSPFSVLTEEELDFLYDYWIVKRKKKSNIKH